MAWLNLGSIGYGKWFGGGVVMARLHTWLGHWLIGDGLVELRIHWLRQMVLWWSGAGKIAHLARTLVER